MSGTLSEADIAQKVREARNFGELSAILGYAHEEHVVTTDDGYLLKLHRLVSSKGHENQPKQLHRPVVYFQHGLLTNSELFMLVTHPRKCLPIVLAEQGYDVWLGNNRGNKYSLNHVDKKVDSPEFWDFCIDDFARYDIPTSLDYVLTYTKSAKLSYIGFSQGSAQAFAAFSIHPDLNERVNVFIALAPIMLPAGYSSSLLNALLKRNPSLIFSIFGRKSMLSSIATLQSILPFFILQKCVDIGLVHLLGAYSKNITPLQKIAAYPHIYCSSSVKAIVHWTQIMRNSAFSTYEHEHESNVASSKRRENEVIPSKRYPTDAIQIPMVLIYGDQDTLFDLDTVMQHLPPSKVTVCRLADYEHLDVLWGGNVHNDVIPNVLEALSRVHR
ncbi:hypothetical protein D9613_009312 [Agrocybe pediades]|uniref:Lipase n=1 Tax=Agrocybe pediades TaxID=84607 RepID=A0A8H4VW27_9AGAR|nr:hypothetical protein D9613_009312 [Agrocybe pediades]